MSWFKGKRTEPELRGWRIITRHNEALDKTVYRVLLPGFVDRFGGRPVLYEDFEDYEEALAYYHEKTGWSAERVEQP